MSTSSSTVSPGGNDRRVLPDEIIARHAVAREHKEPLAVQMDRMIHRMAGRRIVDERILTTSPRRKRQSMSMFSLPRRRIAENPGDFLARRRPVHHRHPVVPLDGGVDADEHVRRRRRADSRLEREDELVIHRRSKCWRNAAASRRHVGVPAQRGKLRRYRRSRRIVEHAHDAERVHLGREDADHVIERLNAIDQRHRSRRARTRRPRHIARPARSRGSTRMPRARTSRLAGHELHPRAAERQVVRSAPLDALRQIKAHDRAALRRRSRSAARRSPE